MSLIRETDRLRIVKFNLEDAAFIVRLVNTQSWLKYIGDRGVNNEEDAIKFLEEGSLKSYETNGFGFYKMLHKESNIAIGTCGLVKRDDLDHIDIGFALLDEYFKQGYGFEASSAIMEFARYDLGIDQLSAITTPDNEASIKLLIKLGLTFDKQIEFGENKEILNLFTTRLSKLDI